MYVLVTRVECWGSTLNCIFLQKVIMNSHEHIYNAGVISILFLQKQWVLQSLTSPHNSCCCQLAPASGASPLSDLLPDWPLSLPGAAGAGHHLPLPGQGPQAAGQPRHQLLALSRPQVEPPGAEAILVRCSFAYFWFDWKVLQLVSSDTGLLL